ncbi:hypothetical protein BGX34_005020 [Mortierella sp. NVP85]|nr:hypothetical protein BGX34_005020 [Mortierella sp. NVP85]
MTVPESSIPVITTAVTPTSTSTKVHSFVRQTPVTSTSFQATQGEGGSGENNGRVSVQPTAFEGGLLVGLYDPHLGPQCAEYLQQHLVPILDESFSTQLDHTDIHDSECRIESIQVVDTLKSTFKELDELLLATAITVALTQPETIEGLESEEEVKKTQEIVAQVVTGSTALVGFLAPHRDRTSTDASDGGGGDQDAFLKHDFYMAQLGDSVAILAGYDAQGQWTAQRLNPPETREHSVRYPGSQEYRKVILEAKERALTIEQYLTQHNGDRGVHSSLPNAGINGSLEAVTDNTFLTRNGKFLGLPVTRAFGDLDWKLEQEARFSVGTWVEKALKDKIDQALGGGPQHLEDLDGDNLNDPPYVVVDPWISRFVLETRKPSSSQDSPAGPSDQFLILLSREMLYTTRALTNPASNDGKVNSYDQALISDVELSRVVADALEKGEENCGWAVAKALDNARRELNGVVINKDNEDEGREGSVIVIVL